MPPKKRLVSAVVDEEPKKAPTKKAAASPAPAPKAKAKADTRPAALIANEKLWLARFEAMGLEGEFRVRHLLRPRNDNVAVDVSDSEPDDDDDDDDDDDGDGFMETEADFAKVWSLVTSDQMAALMAAVEAEVVALTGNEPDDTLMMFGTHSGNCAAPHFGTIAKRVVRLLKTAPPKAFWTLVALFECMTDMMVLMADNELDSGDLTNIVRDVATAARAVLRAPLAALKVDEINMNCLKLLLKQMVEQLPSDIDITGIKWGTEAGTAKKKTLAKKKK
jgi:hypothetical protein